ncbi:hypothetical protein [Jeongeupia naejangsanensis]|uniref:DUF3304 domain-containing protein n=1 Tax=Jeongeupia naejangsanensis TaxID=613195 RepID=A0ABS2BR17_9NEIS|nr:hypothetical protein [Jeongeupia naejangsanensis]MBM3117880.1 hypothetical protein [Jeongeupia naejangsanensis]
MMKMVGILFALSLSACGAESAKLSRMSLQVYNYSSEDIMSVKTGNGEGGMIGLDGTKLGGVTGTGIICCLSVKSGAKELDLLVEYAGKKQVLIKASVEQNPWPAMPGYLTLHFLPKNEVVAEISPIHAFPRRDLIERQMKKYKLKQEVPFSDVMDNGPVVSGR